MQEGGALGAATPATVMYVGGFMFPNQNAGGHRVLNIGKCLRGSGCRVVFLGAEPASRTEDKQGDGSHTYQGFTYISTGHPGRGFPARLRRLVYDYLGGFGVMSRLHQFIPDGAVAVIAYQASTVLLVQLLAYCRRRGLSLLVDSVEWYDAPHMWGGKCGPFALDNALRMRWMQAKVDGVIAISSYLMNYYQTCGRKVLRVPVLVDLEEAHWGAHNNHSPAANKHLSLAFVGTAGKKDRLVNALRGLLLIGTLRDYVDVVVVGPSREELGRHLGPNEACLDQLSPRLRFTGRLPHRQALESLAAADFSILLRPQSRSSAAGFPTKLVESLALGVPVICNLTSDIGMYVHDGQEGLIVDDSSPGAFATGLQRALALSHEQRMAMRAQARLRAQISFDYHNWIGSLGRFMQSVIECGRSNSR